MRERCHLLRSSFVWQPTLATTPALAQAPKFPPVRLIVPFSAGGTPDTLARMVGPRMSDSWRQIHDGAAKLF